MMVWELTQHAFIVETKNRGNLSGGGVWKEMKGIVVVGIMVADAWTCSKGETNQY